MVFATIDTKQKVFLEDCMKFRTIWVFIVKQIFSPSFGFNIIYLLLPFYKKKFYVFNLKKTQITIQENPSEKYFHLVKAGKKTIRGPYDYDCSFWFLVQTTNKLASLTTRHGVLNEDQNMGINWTQKAMTRISEV